MHKLIANWVLRPRLLSTHTRLELIVYLIIYDLSWKMLNTKTQDVQMISNVLPSVFGGDSVGSGRPKSDYENIYLLPLITRNLSLDIV